MRPKQLVQVFSFTLSLYFLGCKPPSAAPVVPSHEERELMSIKECNQGDAVACAAVGATMRNKQRLPEAIGYFKRACELGYGQVCAMLGDEFIRGSLGIKAPVEGLRLLRRACDDPKITFDNLEGREQACMDAGDELLNQAGDPIVVEREALLYYEKVAHGKSPLAQAGLEAVWNLRIKHMLHAEEQGHHRLCGKLYSQFLAAQDLTEAATTTIEEIACDCGLFPGCVPKHPDSEGP